jgi:aminocarboxymuconate-semialdehyde decarboxylase
LPWQYPELALAELEHAATAGAVGIMVIATIDGEPLTAPRFAGIWAAIEQRELPVLVHPGPPPGTAALGLAELGLVPSVGFPFDTTLAFARLFHDGFLDRFPCLQLIAAHGGGALPELIARLDRCHREIPAAHARTSTPPSEYLRRIWLDAVVYGERALQSCLEAVGSDERILFGSDYPHNIGDMAGCLARVDGLPATSARRVRGANAARLFRL